MPPLASTPSVPLPSRTVARSPAPEESTGERDPPEVRARRQTRGPAAGPRSRPRAVANDPGDRLEREVCRLAQHGDDPPDDRLRGARTDHAERHGHDKPDRGPLGRRRHGTQEELHDDLEEDEDDEQG